MIFPFSFDLFASCLLSLNFPQYLENTAYLLVVGPLPMMRMKSVIFGINFNQQGWKNIMAVFHGGILDVTSIRFAVLLKSRQILFILRNIIMLCPFLLKYLFLPMSRFPGLSKICKTVVPTICPCWFLVGRTILFVSLYFFASQVCLQPVSICSPPTSVFLDIFHHIFIVMWSNPFLSFLFLPTSGDA